MLEPAPSLDLPELPPALRERLAPEALAYVLALEAQVASLRAEADRLRAQVEALTARLNQHSQNSSRPPSADPPSAPPRPPKGASKRKRGGQPGHPGHQRALLDASELTAIEVHWPTSCPSCQTALPAQAVAEGEVLRQQVWELPPLEPEVIEHRFPAVHCPCCQATVRAERPAHVPPGSFGPRLTSLVGLLNGRYRLSKREVADLLASAYGVEMSVGMVVRATEQLSAALEAPYDEARAALAVAEQANVDETGWKQAGARRWLWVAVSTVATLFYLAGSRAGRELEHLLGSSFGGIVGSDRYRAYLRLPVAQRQLCWAHLKRDLVACSQASGATGDWGKRALAVEVELFRLWHQFKQQAIDRATLQAQMHPHRETFAALLKEGLTLPAWSKAHAFCKDVSAVEAALWTFLTVQDVEPTNNAAERALRPAVLWRKGCFGSQSASGMRFAERMLTVNATCQQQQRALLPFLTDALAAHWAGLPAPTLLPTP